MIELTHLKRLKTVRSNAGIKLLTPCAYPGSHCPLHTALSLAGNVKGLSTLVIGTPECTNYSRLIVPWPKGENGELHWMYTLDSNEVVFGCRNGLMAALHKMYRAGVKAVMMIATCVPELIGEDLEGLVYEIQSEIKLKLGYVMLGHFKCNSYPSGSWKTLLAIGDMMISAENTSRTVNVLGRSPAEEHEPMPSFLLHLMEQGVQLRFLAPDASFESFMQAPDAVLNLVVSPYTHPLAVKMEERFGIPFISLHNSYRVAEIETAYAQVMQGLGLSSSVRFNDEAEEVYKLQKQVSEKVDGLKYAMGPIGPIMALPIAEYLAQLGMVPVLLHIEEWYPDDRQWSNKLLERGHNPPVCHMASGRLDWRLIEQLEPDVYIGLPLGNSEGLVSVPFMQEIYGKIGYEKTTALLEKLLAALETLPLEKGVTDDGTS